MSKMSIDMMAHHTQVAVLAQVVVPSILILITVIFVFICVMIARDFGLVNSSVFTL